MPLARRLGDDQPIFGIDLYPEDLAELGPPFTLEKFAGRLADQLTRHRPNDCYVLGGWCLASVLAYETARQLRARGENAPLVVMFDPPPPEALVSMARPLHLRVAIELFGARARQLLEVRPRDLPQFISNAVSGLNRRRRQAVWLAKNTRSSDPDQPRFDGWLADVYLAASAYRPKSIDAEVALILPTEEDPERMQRSEAAWRRLLGSKLLVHKIEGDHWKIFEEPRVEALAKLLKPLLEGATTR